MLIPRLLDAGGTGGTGGTSGTGGGAGAVSSADTVVDAIRLITATPWTAAGPGLLVTVGSAGNPLPDLLGRGLAAAGIAAITVPDLSTARAVAGAVRAATEGRARVGVHLHWQHRLVEATTRAGAEQACDAVVADLEALRGAGVAALWTVHNVLPHDAPFDDVQLTLRRAVAAAADLVHVLDPQTPHLAAPYYRLEPATVRHVPHPGWHGVYPDWVSRERARARLALPPDAVVYVLFGRLSADKGVADLVEAFTAPDTLPGARLLLAGPPQRDPDDRTAAALALAARHPAIDIWPVRVADDHVQVVLRAADIAVSPQRLPLNSGSRMLALTFGLPLVTTVRADGEPAPGPDHAVAAPAGDVGALRAGLLEADRRLRTPAARAAARAAADAVHPDLVAGQFTALVGELLDATESSVISRAERHA